MLAWGQVKSSRGAKRDQQGLGEVAQGLNLRLAKVSDASEIATMSREFIESGLGWSWTPTRVTRSIQCPEASVLVAHGKRMVGFAIMFFGTDKAHLNLLAVAPAYRRAGLGCQLVLWLERSALIAGISNVCVEVRARNRGAQAFYTHLGYRRIGRLPGYYRGRETAVRMAHELRSSFANP